MRALTSNENKMSDGGRGRGSRAVKVAKSSQKWSVQRSAVRSIAWLDARVESSLDSIKPPTVIKHDLFAVNLNDPIAFEVFLQWRFGAGTDVSVVHV